MSVAHELPVTADDLERLSDEGHRYELVLGELEPMSPVGGGQGNATINLSSEMTVYVRRNKLGECFCAETGFILARNPDTVLAPDWSFIVADRLAGKVSRSFVALVPDVILETRSPNDSARQIQRKIRLWLSAGVKAALDLDPEQELLIVHRGDSEPVVLDREGTFELDDLLPGFRLELRELFR